MMLKRSSRIFFAGLGHGAYTFETLLESVLTMIFRKILGIVVVYNRRLFVRMGDVALFIDWELLSEIVHRPWLIYHASNILLAVVKDEPRAKVAILRRSIFFLQTLVKRQQVLIFM